MLVPGEGPLLRPRGTILHYEVELGLVMGKTLRDSDPADEKQALDAIHSELNLAARQFRRKKKKKKKVSNTNNYFFILNKATYSV